VIDAGSGKRVEAVAATTVRFGTPSEDEIAAYVGTGEPLGMAGGFTIEGLGGWFVESIDGDHGNVIGISLPLLRRLLGSLGVTIPALWAQYNSLE
jgi:septum formation protein